jgi:hypothetical protein
VGLLSVFLCPKGSTVKIFEKQCLIQIGRWLTVSLIMVNLSGYLLKSKVKFRNNDHCFTVKMVLKIMTSLMLKCFTLCDVVLCSAVKVNWHFKGTYRFHHYGQRVSKAGASKQSSACFMLVSCFASVFRIEGVGFPMHLDRLLVHCASPFNFYCLHTLPVLVLTISPFLPARFQPLS